MAGPSLSDYARRAFFFRPFGMFVPPNLVLLVFFGLLGLREPGLWLVGLGVELAVLLSMVSHPRFRALVEREHAAANDTSGAELAAALARLSPEGRARFHALEGRCQELLDGSPIGDVEADALSSLLQVQLELLTAREGVARLLTDADRSVDERLRQLRVRLSRADEALRASLEGQIAVLERRANARLEASNKLEFVDSELQRVDDQVELLREQSLLQTEPAEHAGKVDSITHALDATRRWLAEERASSGVSDRDAAPVPVLKRRGRAGVAQ